ncbi:hypothetical protein CW713_05755, partial [Methanophagales archaeon]
LVMAATVFCGTPQNNRNTTITHLISRDVEFDAKKSLDTFIIVSFVFIFSIRRSGYLKITRKVDGPLM